MGIDQELYDAAEVDGCGRFRQIWYVTLPGIRRIFIVLLVLKLGTILDAGFNQVYVMMNDQVKLSGEIIDTWIYTRGIGKLNYSLSTAVGLLKSVIAAVLVFGTNKLARKWDSAIW
jgi:putative aldouronate transport system permease protein